MVAELPKEDEVEDNIVAKKTWGRRSLGSGNTLIARMPMRTEHWAERKGDALCRKDTVL